jgi:hypothetical protein
MANIVKFSEFLEAEDAKNGILFEHQILSESYIPTFADYCEYRLDEQGTGLWQGIKNLGKKAYQWWTGKSWDKEDPKAAADQKVQEVMSKYSEAMQKYVQQLNADFVSATRPNLKIGMQKEIQSGALKDYFKPLLDFNFIQGGGLGGFFKQEKELIDKLSSSENQALKQILSAIDMPTFNRLAQQRRANLGKQTKQINNQFEKAQQKSLSASGQTGVADAQNIDFVKKTMQNIKYNNLNYILDMQAIKNIAAAAQKEQDQNKKKSLVENKIKETLAQKFANTNIAQDKNLNTFYNNNYKAFFKKSTDQVLAALKSAELSNPLAANFNFIDWNGEDAITYNQQEAQIRKDMQTADDQTKAQLANSLRTLFLFTPNVDKNLGIEGRWTSISQAVKVAGIIASLQSPSLQGLYNTQKSNIKNITDKIVADSQKTFKPKPQQQFTV